MPCLCHWPQELLRFDLRESKRPGRFAQPRRPSSWRAHGLADTWDEPSSLPRATYIPLSWGNITGGLLHWQQHADTARGDWTPPWCDGTGLSTQLHHRKQYWSQQSLMVPRFPSQLKIWSNWRLWYSSGTRAILVLLLSHVQLKSHTWASECCKSLRLC